MRFLQQLEMLRVFSVDSVPVSLVPLLNSNGFLMYFVRRFCVFSSSFLFSDRLETISMSDVIGVTGEEFPTMPNLKVIDDIGASISNKVCVCLFVCLFVCCCFRFNN
jgi:hypothetical protein